MATALAWYLTVALDLASLTFIATAKNHVSQTVLSPMAVLQL
jgi:hypothetical protein